MGDLLLVFTSVFFVYIGLFDHIGKVNAAEISLAVFLGIAVLYHRRD